jgi:hypothetical protein
MSETVLVALVTGGVGVAGIAFGFWSSSRERQQRLVERRDDYREWYRRTMFEKRLEVAQEAYAWLMKLNTGMNLADPKNPDGEQNRKLAQTCLDARDWYDNSALLLYDDLPKSSSFVGLTNTAGQYAGGRADHDLRMWEVFMEADREIRDRVQELLTADKGRRSSSGGR